MQQGTNMALSKQDIETLASMDACDMIEWVLEEPTLLDDSDMLEAFRVHNHKLNTGEIQI